MMGRIDIDDAFVSPFFVLASAFSAGVLPDWSPGGVSVTADLIDFGSGAGLAFVDIVAVISIAFVIASNRPSLKAMSAIEAWVAVATVGLVLAPPFAPILASLIGSHIVIGVLTVILQAGGFYALSYLG